jgi:class 3 adenylate cyclase
MPATTQTFLFADLAGYTAVTEAHGDEHAADVAAEFVRSVRTLVDEYGGEHVKAIGDAVLVRVDDPAAALELARRVVRGRPLGGDPRGHGRRGLGSFARCPGAQEHCRAARGL